MNQKIMYITADLLNTSRQNLLNCIVGEIGAFELDIFIINGSSDVFFENYILEINYLHTVNGNKIMTEHVMYEQDHIRADIPNELITEEGIVKFQISLNSPLGDEKITCSKTFYFNVNKDI